MTGAPVGDARPASEPEASGRPARRARVDGAAPPLPGPPGPGARTHAATRRVRLADVTPDGRVRLDSVARYLQDVAGDDAREAGLGDHRWVVRRTYLELARRPRYEELVRLETWCSGTGAAWAERRTSIRTESGPGVEAAALWVNLDPLTMRPVALSGGFDDAYGAAAGGRQVRARLLHPDPTERDGRSGYGERIGECRWPLRSADFDVLGHVNNAVAWALLDELVGRVAPARSVRTAEVEYREPIAAVRAVEVRWSVARDVIAMWVSPEGGAVAVTALAGLGSGRTLGAERVGEAAPRRSSPPGR